MRTVKDLAAWAAILVTLLGALLYGWGQFARLEQRMDDADTDRRAMMETLDRIEQRLIALPPAR